MKDNSPASACIGRREFLVKTAIAAGGVMLTITSTGSASVFEDVTVVVGPDSPLAKVGGSVYADSSAGKLIIIRTGDATYSAFSAVCTHKRGTLTYDAAKKSLDCPKHGSKFDAASGSVTSGPAETPVASYPAKAAAGAVTVKVG